MNQGTRVRACYFQQCFTQGRASIPLARTGLKKGAPTLAALAQNLAAATSTCGQHEKCGHSAPPAKIIWGGGGGGGAGGRAGQGGQESPVSLAVSVWSGVSVMLKC